MKITTTTQRTASTMQSAERRPILTLPFCVRVDNREQLPWKWSGMVGNSADKRAVKSTIEPLLVVPQKVQYMPTADYFVGDDETGVGVYIERKADDLISSLSEGHTRFRGEHERLRQLVADGSEAWVIVEQSLSAILWECDYGGRRMSSETVLTAVATWQDLYSVRWIFAGDRATAERMALKIFRLWWNRREREKQGELFE